MTVRVCLWLGIWEKYISNLRWAKIDLDLFGSLKCSLFPKGCPTCRGLDQWRGDHGDYDGQVAMFLGHGGGRCGGGLCDSIPGGWQRLGAVGSIRRAFTALC